mmetsp:Transcript_11316/g.16671  ORF Transcript_11316/g.16671 Transcript_11316/m.16671 type:complete len:83 (-) Transcript_11316:2273-2521(-)
MRCVVLKGYVCDFWCGLRTKNYKAVHLPYCKINTNVKTSNEEANLTFLSTVTNTKDTSRSIAAKSMKDLDDRLKLLSSYLVA